VVAIRLGDVLRETREGGRRLLATTGDDGA
jgi:hypothetical protein